MSSTRTGAMCASTSTTGSKVDPYREPTMKEKRPQWHGVVERLLACWIIVLPAIIDVVAVRPFVRHNDFVFGSMLYVMVSIIAAGSTVVYEEGAGKVGTLSTVQRIIIGVWWPIVLTWAVLWLAFRVLRKIYVWLRYGDGES
jgi:hypothetical protein